jgi:hypothetical protein
VISQEEFASRDKVYLLDLSECEIYLPFSMKAFYAKNVSSCKVYVGAVEGGALIYEMKNSEIQFRSH